MRFMRSLRRQLRRRLAWRSKPLLGVCLVLYLAGGVGFPLPELPAVSHGDGDYPCRGHRCGCASAHDCWTHCCCFTIPERLAWCRSRGLQPPPALAEQAEHAAARPACAHCRAAAAPPPPQPADGSWKLRFVLAVQARKCRGWDTTWTGAVLAMPPVPPVCWVFDAAEAGRLVPDVWRPSSLRLPPDPPPPRAA